ncbi:MAG TPA: hypothetical protein DCK76_03415 [Desulfotomaculum sp.]|nr:hypothetical protein [Desulfotomaculum sp.]HBY04028.1 hypothetical protein [Desulfotomaculum sp.]
MVMMVKCHEESVDSWVERLLKRRHPGDYLWFSPRADPCTEELSIPSLKWDLRLFSKTPRNSKAWKKVYARRSASERTNKRQKIDYRLERTRARSKRRIFWRLTLGAINQHLDAWVNQSRVTLAEIIGIKQAA